MFPGREIVQPTVVDPVSFRAWREEAFELWRTQWAGAYKTPERGGTPEEQEARGVIDRIRKTYWLVNVVDNDYARSDAPDEEADGPEVHTTGDEDEEADAPVAPAAQGIYSALRAAVTRRMGTAELRGALGSAARREERLARRVASLEAALGEAGEEAAEAAMRAAAAESEAARLRAEIRLLRARGAASSGGGGGGSSAAVGRRGRSGTRQDGPGAVRWQPGAGGGAARVHHAAVHGRKLGSPPAGANGDSPSGGTVSASQLFGRCAPGYGSRLNEVAGEAAASGALVAAGASSTMQIGFVADGAGSSSRRKVM